MEGMPILVDGQVSITGSQFVRIRDAGIGFRAILAGERRIGFLKLLESFPLRGVDAAITRFDTHVALLRRTWRGECQNEIISRVRS
jgi:hypothetical protein